MNHHLNEFCRTTRELLASEQVRSMGRWNHHGRITTLDHSLFVAYWSYRAAKRWGWTPGPPPGAGCSTTCISTIPGRSRPTTQPVLHPPGGGPEERLGLCGSLTPMEENIIVSHMWPLAKTMPRSREAWLVDLVDTFCAALELARIYHPGRLREQMGVEPLLEKASPCLPLLTDI